MHSARAIPHTRSFLADTLTPLGLYRRLRDLSPCRFLFESVTGGEQVSRFSFLGVEPREIFRLHADRLEVERQGTIESLPGSPLEALAAAIDRIQADPLPIPFAGGLVGMFGYDLIRLVERLPNKPSDPFGLPIALLARYDTAVVFDHALQRLLVLSNEIEGEVSAVEAQQRLDVLSDAVTREEEGGAVGLPTELPGLTETLPPSLSGADYRRAVEVAKEYIAAGDIFQVVLARRWKVARNLDPLVVYRALRMVNPSPYMVLVEMPDVSVVAASPEMLVRKSGQELENRPIAGTRPRGKSAEEDRHLANDLLADPKERAEHVMLVDLGRNDLGKVAKAGSVQVASFMEVENYSHVMHIVSSVVAELDERAGALDVLLGCFPAGTLSGAPKIRAMEIIDELEPESRGIYGGAIGYISYTGDLDTCIAIRTLVMQKGETSVTAGAGIVADSDPQREEEETENKAAALLQAVSLAEVLEDGS